MSRPSDASEAAFSPAVSSFVCSKQELVEKRKIRCNVNGREIVIFYHNRDFYAMDQRCYRKLSSTILELSFFRCGI